MKYKLENSEIYRLSILSNYKILDTDFDSHFDNLVAIVSAHFSAPIALVSLVDADRQWFKAMVGLDIRQTPRHHSFCTHAILRPNEVMVVEDAWVDPRFHDNPWIGPDSDIRFYAGAPIVTDSGDALGTVAIVDHVPRTFDAADKEMLARFSGTALALLELHRRNELLREGATRDTLTGLLNRRGLERTLRQITESALNGEGCGLLYIDLDGFKQINETYGYAIGDSLLEEMGRRLQFAVRQGDLVARFGGDEFMVLLTHPVDATVLELVAHRLLWACVKPFTIKGHTITPTITMGGALGLRDAITPSDLLRAVDQALYSAKRAGHGQLVIEGPYDKSETEGNKSQQIALSDAIDRDELFLEWQSCHDIKTGQISGYEALVRWQHPELGRIAPDRFIPLAEACGLSSRLDAWVMFHACQEAAACKGDCYFSINLSAQWLANGNVVPLIRAALEQSDLSPGRLILEITETTAIGSEDGAIAHMRQLREMGVRLALDDFGTGYSALVCLQIFPFDVLKLDRKFVTAISANTRGRMVAEGVIQLAKMLDIEVVAEGIETQAQADVLSQIGCRLGQGYLWATPRSAPWLRNSNENAPALIGHASTKEKVTASTAPFEPPLLDALPPPDTTRWTPRRKAEVVAAVNGGVISIDYVCSRYNLTLEEFTSWQRAVDRSGLTGLCITRTQFYRDLHEDAAKHADEISPQRDMRHNKINGLGEVADPADADRPIDDMLTIHRRINTDRENPLSDDELLPKPIGPERRGASRMALLLRVAKLVVDDYEQFCIIRDASTTGVKVKLFVPLPDHDELAIELANGDRYKVQCVWTAGENVGLKFCEPVQLERLLDFAKDTGRRRHIRLRIALKGLLHIGDTAASITFYDVSQHGAAFRTDKWLLVNELIKIETTVLPAVYAKVRWRNHPHYGVVFERTFQLKDLAVRIAEAQGRLDPQGDAP